MKNVFYSALKTELRVIQRRAHYVQGRASRDEGKLIKGIANGLEGEQGTTCFLEPPQLRGLVCRLLGPQPKVSMILSKTSQVQDNFLMSIYFTVLSEISSTRRTDTSIGAEPPLPHLHRLLQHYLCLYSQSTPGVILLVCFAC